MVRVLEVTPIGMVTGEDSVNHTGSGFGVYGTDLGIIWANRPGEVLLAFGDTYGQEWGGSGAGPAHADWRCNFVARSTTTLLDQGLTLEPVARRGDGAAAQAIDRAEDRDRESTVIPTSGIAVDGVNYLAYMSVQSWGDPGRWHTNHAGIAVSEDNGLTWRKPDTARWPNERRQMGTFDRPRDHPFQIAAFTRDADHVYLFGTPAGRFGSASLARVSPDQVLSPGRYQYWTGSDFSADDPFGAVPIMAGPVGELSVRFNQFTNSWLAMHLDERRAAIVLREAPNVTGPWSDGVPVVEGSRYPGLYGGYLHPWTTADPVVYFTMSQWGPYNVSLVRAVLATGW
ncbi:MAG TPA: DUF4185 domain-containing protein [Pseudonocardiaceae bacterium]|jgi:hypothetical protein|nr:DUF4185 domain-containing protein [Pseudonocardiaceae bacterium]